MKISHVYLAIAFTIDKKPDGSIVPCADCRASCDKAVELAGKRQGDDWVIMMTAGKLDGYDTTLAALMSEDLRQRYRGFPAGRIVTREGKLFRTIGEMLELIEYLKENPSVTHVTICVKYWHAARCQDILLQLLMLEGLDRRVAVTVAPCDSDPSAETLRTEMTAAARKHMVLMWALPKIYRARAASGLRWKAMLWCATQGYRVRYHVDPPWAVA